MKTKATLKMMVDLAMTALFLGQMGYHMMDNRMHEWTGVTLLVLFILHHFLLYLAFVMAFSLVTGCVVNLFISW